jgi:hypothetical protein
MKTPGNKSSALCAVVVCRINAVLTVVCIVATNIVLSCAGTRNPAYRSDEAINTAYLFNDSLAMFHAAGDVFFSLQGERHKTQAVVELKKNTDFSCSIYGPFMQPVAVLSSNTDSARIYVEEQEFRYSINDTVQNIPFFKGFPIIFSDMVRILTGRVIKKDVFLCDPSRQEDKGREKIMYWESDSLTVQMVLVHGGKKVKLLRYEVGGTRPWTCEYSLFEDGLFKEMQFRVDEKNYFSLKYDHIK